MFALALLLACRTAGPDVVETAETGVMGQSEAIQGRDGGERTRLWDRWVWSYGDTVLNVEDEDRRMGSCAVRPIARRPPAGPRRLEVCALP